MVINCNLSSYRKHRSSYRWYIEYSTEPTNLRRFYLDFKTKAEAISTAQKIFREGIVEAYFPDGDVSRYKVFLPRAVYVLDKLYIPCGDKVVYDLDDRSRPV